MKPNTFIKWGPKPSARNIGARLYQAVADSVVAIRFQCGHAAFNEVGRATAEGNAEVLLHGESHLGSRRDQAMAAWDYDADLLLVRARRDKTVSQGEG